MEAGEKEKLERGDQGAGRVVGLSLSKIRDGADLSRLVEELSIVDSLWGAASEQWEGRKWEYCMALRAARGQGIGAGYPLMALDIGGAGSPLVHMLTRLGYSTHVVDPKVNYGLEHVVRAGVQADLVTCVSVIEHVPDLQQFIWELAQVVRPGGRLFLTTDMWDQEGEDRAHWHWMRERIFTPKTWSMVAAEFLGEGFEMLGGAGEWEWRGETLANWGYNLCSLALQKATQ